MTVVRKGSMAFLFASELFASAVGFGVMVTMARRLGRSGFADYEYASAVAAWWLVVVRGGFDSIVYREAARRPKLVRPLASLLIGLRLASALVALVAVLGFAWASGGDRGRVVMVAGLVLIPSALASDVGLRASGRFGALAIAQAVRAVGLAVGVLWLVTGPGDASIAAVCVVVAEVGSSVILLVLSRPEQGGTLGDSGSLPPCGGGLGWGGRRPTLDGQTSRFRCRHWSCSHPPPQPSPTRGEGARKSSEPYNNRGFKGMGIRPRFRRRAWSALARRGAIAGASRFARVGLYAADLLILGTLASASLGSYAAARRVAFALLALGLVVPSAVAPRIARAWASGVGEARLVIARSLEGMMLVALPATVGLMATADRWMPWLFGEGFRDGGPWLALIAARLPFVLASNVQQAALIACRREGLALRLVLGMVGLGVVALPPLAMVQGAWGVGLGVLGVEMLGAIGGWLALRNLGVAPPWHHASGPSLAGCVGLVAVCLAGRNWPLAGVVIAGAGVYGMLALVLRKGSLAESSRELVPRRAGLALPSHGSRQGKPCPTGKAAHLERHWRGDAPHPGPLPKGEGEKVPSAGGPTS